MIMPSSVGVMEAPMAFRLSATTWMRSVSLTFNSSASLIMVRPEAWVAKRAMIGSSSIKRGIKSPEISVPWRSEVSTTRVAALATGSRSKIWSLPPIFSITSRMPVRVSLMPTFSRRIWLLGTIKPATNQKAALEISPGTVTSQAWKLWGPRKRISLPFTLIRPPNCWIISSVWFRVSSFSRMTDSPSACIAAKRRADLTCAEATGNE